MSKQHVIDEASTSLFAELSGDHNPIHVDALAARRTLFGRPVAHGVHGLLWALAAMELEPGLRITGFKAGFHAPLPVGGTATLEQIEVASPGFRLRLECDGQVVARIRGRTTSAATGETRGAVPTGSPPHGSVQDRSIDDLAELAGTLPLLLDATRIDALFPRLLDRLGAAGTAAVLATTRAVGMDCPGRHSLLAGLELALDDPAATGRPELSYRVCDVDPRFGRAELELGGPGITGRATTLLRSPPRAQATAEQLAGLVRPGEFSGQRALVIGGSRGIGEVTAKLLAAGGADVVLTYHRGAEEATQVAQNIRDVGGRARAIAWDARDPATAVQDLASGWVPTWLGYFAAPHIGQGQPACFSRAMFAGFCDTFVTGFAAAVERILALDPPRLEVLYPSSAFVDERPPEQAEYVAAKVAAEAVCGLLEARHPALRTACPRLPKMLTDQTQSLLHSDCADPAPLLLATLRQLHQQV